MRNVVYKSFEGKLDVNQSGYVITDAGKFWEIEFLSVDTERPDIPIRIKKELLPESDFGNLMEWKYVRLVEEINEGISDSGQSFFRGRWYGYDEIQRLQTANKSYNWRKFVK